MDNELAKELCLELMSAQTCAEVVELLSEYGFWQDEKAWRYYGDNENNFSVIGNQQSSADAALIEKVVNSIDAWLINRCLLAGIDPESAEAPSSIEDAVKKFASPALLRGGRQNITLSAVGPTQGRPCLLIADCGEGQTPHRMPSTFLSLVSGQNKLRVPFVQGKFNMGGTGVLKFCGEDQDGIQLILSRRNPRLLGPDASPSDRLWGFTVVRREKPTGNRRSSVYTYLAPLNSDVRPRHGDVLRFGSSTMPIFPDEQNPYAVESEWGTLIVLYEYDVTGFRSHMLRWGGLLRRIEVLLPKPALPIRLYECRDYRSKSTSGRSFENSARGIIARLEDRAQEILEPGFPKSCVLSAGGERFTARIYVFKPDADPTQYRRSREGILFVVNGQTHATFPTTFFTEANLAFLQNSLVVVVDCSNVSIGAREDMFMNSRDRLSDCQLTRDVVKNLRYLLRDNAELRRLNQVRRQQYASKASDTGVSEVLAAVIKRSPSLLSLFAEGKSLPNPYSTKPVQTSNRPFRGKRFPTFFKFRGKQPGFVMKRECVESMPCRVFFETDAQDDYFDRDLDPGRFVLKMVRDGNNNSVDVSDYVLNLESGIASLALHLPPECRVGETYSFVAEVSDRTRFEPFSNKFHVLVREAPKQSSKHEKARKKEGGKTPTKKKGRQRDIPGTVRLPDPIGVGKDEWQKYGFTEYSALKIMKSGDYIQKNGVKIPTYDFFVNTDNRYLLSEIKATGSGPDTEVARFKAGMTLIGLSLIREHYLTNHSEDTKFEALGTSSDSETLEDRVARVSSALSLTILPMIKHLSEIREAKSRRPRLANE